MCSVFFAFKTHVDLLFLLAFNRDEYFDRLTAPVHFWDDEEAILAGRDLERKGTWLGVTRQGRFACVTNFREVDPSQVKDARSRGELVSNFLQGVASPLQYMLELAPTEYNGFNLVVGDLSTGDIAYHTNRDTDGPVKLVPGTYGISNGTLNSAWRKVLVGKDALQVLMEEGLSAEGEVPWDAVFERVLGSRERVQDDAQLPRTGLPLEWERQLSPVLLEPMQASGGTYGTRSQTVLAVFKNGRSELRERTISKDGTFEEKAHKFRADLSHRSSRELRERRESAESEADEQPSDLPARPYTDVRYQPGLRGLNTNFRQQVSI